MMVDKHAFVGVDTDGNAHHLDRARDRVYCIAPGGSIRWVTDLGGAAAADNTDRGNVLAEYVHEFVPDRTGGWHDRPFITTTEVFGHVD